MKDFLIFLRPLRVELSVIAAIMAVLGVVMHVLFPFPFVFPDSGSYVLYAVTDGFNVYRPMGYSNYLGLLHSLAPNFGFVFTVSYTLNAVSTLFLLYSARYILKIDSKWIFYPLCLFSIFAPRLLFSTNFIMSDGLFTSLTMLFIATGLWICRTRKMWMTAVHLAIFALLYGVRFSGMFYVAVTVYALAVSPAVLWRGRTGKVVLALAPVLLFMALQSSAKGRYERETGVKTLSSFSGWQLANNASVLVPDARKMSRQDFAGNEQVVLNTFVGSFPDSLFSTKNVLSTSLMWYNDYPYKQFMFMYMQQTGKPYINAWVETGRIYSGYGLSLIKRYPGKFVSRFVLPSLAGNFKFKPINEDGNDFVNEDMYRTYYGVEQERMAHSCRIFSGLNPVRKVINPVYWLALLAATAFFLARIKRFRTDGEYRTAMTILLFIVCYIGISSLAAPNTTWRYTMPVFVPSLVFLAYCLQTALPAMQRYIPGGKEDNTD